MVVYRSLLEKRSLLDKNRRLQSINNNSVAVPITVPTLQWSDLGLDNRENPCQIEKLNLPSSKKAALEKPVSKLKRKVYDLLEQDGRVVYPAMLSDLPSQWEKHGDLILVSGSSFKLDVWQEIGGTLWQVVSKCLGGRRLARKSYISTDGYRSPQVTLLYGDNGMVEHTDNGISYRYDVTKCMFSIGNITEKIRIANFDCEGETVVDLYAGIGYFTLPYLVHARAKHVIACDWNHAAIDALHSNLVLNHVQHRCTVLEGDNRKVCPHNVADRVNLGLIPSSAPGWRVACAALKTSQGGMLHIHQNVESMPDSTFFKTEGDGTSLGVATTPTIKGQDTKMFMDNSVLDEGRDSEVYPGWYSEGYSSREQCASGPRVHASRNCQQLCSELATSGCSHERCSGIYTELENSNDVENKIATAAQLGVEERSSEVAEQFPPSETGIDLKGCEHQVCSHDVDSNVAKSKLFHNIDNRVVPSKLSCNKKVKAAWLSWSCDTSERIKALLQSCHGGLWMVEMMHLEHVKSYAPHVDHLVLDLKCHPKRV